MTARALPEDGPPAIPPVERPRFHRVFGALCFPGAVDVPGAGPVDTSAMPESHPGGVTRTTLRNEKLTRPVEQYPGEAERMIDTWTRLATAAIQRARDATTGPRLVSEIEEAQHAIGEALRWAKP